MVNKSNTSFNITNISANNTTNITNISANNTTNMTNITVIDIIYKNSLNDYLNFLFILILSIVIIRFFKFVIVKRLKELAKKTESKIDDIAIDIIDKIHWTFFVLLALFIAINFIYIPEFIITILNYLTVIYLVYYAIKMVHILIDYYTDSLIKKKQKYDKELDVTVIHVMNKFLKYFLWVIVVIVALDNLKINVSALITGLGIGGIAVALALQNVLGDMFASFSIYFDKPFKVGDYIIFGDNEGTVKQIGIKSTRIEALQGQEIVISNRQLIETIVHNYKRMQYRRIIFKIYVNYNTDVEIVKKIPDIIKDIITKIDNAQFGRTHFSTFGDFGLVFEIVYNVLSNDFKTYMDVQQTINLAIKEKFKEEGIEMTYPTQVIQTQLDLIKSSPKS